MRGGGMSICEPTTLSLWSAELQAPGAAKQRASSRPRPTGRVGILGRDGRSGFAVVGRRAR